MCNKIITKRPLAGKTECAFLRIRFPERKTHFSTTQRRNALSCAGDVFAGIRLHISTSASPGQRAGTPIGGGHDDHRTAGGGDLISFLPPAPGRGRASPDENCRSYKASPARLGTWTSSAGSDAPQGPIHGRLSGPGRWQHAR